MVLVPVTIGLGALIIIAHWSMARTGITAVSFVFHTYTTLGASVWVPTLACEAIDPIGLPLKCINTWKSTFVYSAKVGFPVSNSICCLRTLSFLFKSARLLVGYRGSGTLLTIVFFSPFLYIMSFEMWHPFQPTINSIGVPTYRVGQKKAYSCLYLK